MVEEGEVEGSGEEERGGGGEEEEGGEEGEEEACITISLSREGGDRE